MIPPQFRYARPGTLDEAIALLAAADAVPLAGGQSLLQDLKARAVAPSLLVDLGGLSGLTGIALKGGSLTIGALTTHRAIEDTPELDGPLPILRQAVRVLGDPLVRNLGTFGGSLAYADPGGDWPAVALTLDARLRTQSEIGTRTVAVDDFFLDARRTALRHDEILTQIDLPVRPGARTAYLKLRHPASGYALVGAAASVELDRAGRVERCRLAFGGVGPVPQRATDAEVRLLGEPLTPDTIRTAAEFAAHGMHFLSDVYAGPDYRAHLVRVYAERVLLKVL